MASEKAEYSIAIINPNSSESMTKALEPVASSLRRQTNANDVTYTFYTSPASSPPSINNPADALLSSAAFLNNPNPPSLPHILEENDAFLIACYSPHPLVQGLRERTGKPVLGIFEASVDAAIALLSIPKGRKRKWGIVTTGEGWRRPLEEGVKMLLGRVPPDRLDEEGSFKAVECVGLNAGDLHDEPEDEGVVGQGEREGKVEGKVKDATGRLLKDGDVGVVVLGCAGMVGMEEWVRDVGMRVEGEESRRRDGGGEGGGAGGEAKGGGEGQISVVDGVKAGLMILEEMVKRRPAGEDGEGEFAVAKGLKEGFEEVFGKVRSE